MVCTVHDAARFGSAVGLPRCGGWSGVGRPRSSGAGAAQDHPRYRMRPAEAARVVGVEYRVEDGTQDTVVALRLQLSAAAGRALGADEDDQEAPSVLEGCEFEVAAAARPASPPAICAPRPN